MNLRVGGWVLLAALAAHTASAETIGFDSLSAGSAPGGWTATKTGKGDSDWKIVADNSAPSKPNVLKQSGEATFPICILEGTGFKDGFVEVKFKPVSGKEDQAGGVIWRCQDANTYYVARANALEDNVTIYHTINGKRTSFKNTSVKVAPGVWHTLRVEFQGTNFKVLFNDRQVIEASDEAITEAGRVGLWTKADSVTLFDDFRFEGR